jgi:DUF1680 family protein
MNTAITLLLGGLLSFQDGKAVTPFIEPVPFVVPPKLADVAELLPPSHIRVDGWLGARIDANARRRLMVVDLDPLLAGYRKRPGSHPWIGEHIGKWMHAATLAWVYTADPALRGRLDRAAAELIACQEADGYLGTYVPEKRFGLYKGADWDVWSHKYNLIGLLTYYQYTGNSKALAACRKMGDLLIATFPRERSILAAGTHVGMAATSVLEPTVLLYRFTGDERYLDFARYLVRSWDEPEGPKILTSLKMGKGVNETANAKAYEMLSNLVGLCELARATGDRSLLGPVLHAWDDIVTNRLYVTGSASAGELFHEAHELPNQVGAHIGETCVTTTWIQLNLQLLRLMGQARFGHELERSFYNHLSAAQHPRGDDWCYYTALEGKKPYDPGINCCHSSGPRGMALAVQAAYLKVHAGSGEGLYVNTLESSSADATLGGHAVKITQKSKFPREGESVLTVENIQPTKFAVVIRIPPWAGDMKAEITQGDGEQARTTRRGDELRIPEREWKAGDQIKLSYQVAPRMIAGTYGNEGRVALAWGPFVLAYDVSRNPGLPPARLAGVANTDPILRLEPGASLAFRGKVVGREGDEPRPAVFVPFADAGVTGGVYGVWLRAPGVALPASASLLFDGEESRSRPGNQGGSILDGDAMSFVVTFDGARASEDWYEVTMAAPANLDRFVFRHGRNFHDGGWFDASKGKPRVQVRRSKDGPWETVATLEGYPETTSTDGKSLRPGTAFEARLKEPVSATAIRVLGTPSSGDNPGQAFSSCGELEAYPD